MNPLLLPLVAAQGKWVRRRIDLLPEASGPTSGITAGPDGSPFRLVIVGESTAAGCGADIAVLLIGANDAMGRAKADEWSEDFTTVLDALTERAGVVIVAGIPSFRSFPSLPRTLRAYLAERAETLDDIAREVCAARPSVSWIGGTELGLSQAEFFARDGFRPSPAGYQSWVNSIIEQLVVD